MTGTYIKVRANTVVINATANDFFSAKLVRVINGNTTPALITIANTTPANLATVIILPGQEAFIVKDPTDTLVSNNNATVWGVNVGMY